MIEIRICGHDSHHPSGFCMEYPHGIPDYLLLLVKTGAWFILDGQKKYTEPNMAILFDKNSYVCYGCEHAGYNDDWIHFDLPESDHILDKDLSIPFGKPLYLSQLHTLSHYVLLLTSVFYNSHLHQEQQLDSMMRMLLYAMDEQFLSIGMPYMGDKHYAAFQNLRTKLYNNPGDNWTISSMARSLDLSISYFQYLYRNFFQCSCQQDIIRARIAMAKYQLSSSEISIRNLSKYCGYENDIHFMRQFKKMEGMTPSEFRKTVFHPRT